MTDKDIIAKYRKAIDDIYNSGIAGRELVIKHFGIHHPGHGAIPFATKEERQECVAWLQRIHGKCTEQNCKIKLVLEVYHDYLTWETFNSDLLFEMMMHVLDKEDPAWRDEWQLYKNVKHVNYT